MKNRKNIYFQFFKFFIISIFVLSFNVSQAQDYSWKEREKQFHENDKTWIAEEKAKEQAFFEQDSLFFEQDKNWQNEKDLNALQKDREWIRSEKN